MNNEYKICNRCLMDSTTPYIKFYDYGGCNYCHQFDAISKDAVNDSAGNEYITALIEDIKKNSKNRQYDVVVGVSGGVDSTFLVHYAIQHGLRVLAVNFDNGWHSEIAVSNIKSSLSKLNVDLVTYVVNYEVMRDLLLSYMKAGLPWIDLPTDLALLATLYKVADDYNVKAIFVGNSFRTEGRQPNEWTHGDTRQLKYIHRKFGKGSIKSFPLLSPFHLFYYGAIKGIKMVRPFNYLSYDKATAKEMLIKEYGWKDYGGHHHESAFTKFAIAYWLPKKFGIDKRKVTYSAQVRSGLLQRDKALEMLSKPPYDPKMMEEDKEYVIKKLGITANEFQKIWDSPNKSIYDYPSYLPFFNKYLPWFMKVFRFILPFKPMMGYELDRG